jgi:hypothetical protein
MCEAERFSRWGKKKKHVDAYHGDDRARGEVLNESLEERLLLEVIVVTGSLLLASGEHLHAHELVATLRHRQTRFRLRGNADDCNLRRKMQIPSRSGQ